MTNEDSIFRTNLDSLLIRLLESFVRVKTLRLNLEIGLDREIKVHTVIGIVTLISDSSAPTIEELLQELSDCKATNLGDFTGSGAQYDQIKLNDFLVKNDLTNKN